MRRFLLCAPVLLAACVSGSAGLQGSVGASIRVRVQPPPPPRPAVALSGAAVVEFFGVPLDDAQDVVFVLDLSGSMDQAATGAIASLAPSSAPPPAPPPPGQPNTAPPGQPAAAPAPPPPPRKVDVARRELVTALQGLPAGIRMNVLLFNNGVQAFATTLVPMQEGERAGLVSFVERAEPSGSTALAPALRTAYLMNPRRIVLLSDGLGNVGGESPHILRDAREAIQGGVRIDAIGIGPDQDRELMQALATESGGLYQAL